MERSNGFDISGIRFAKYDATDEVINNLKNLWHSFVDGGISEYPKHFSGRGVVYCGGGMRYFTCSWVSIHLLRHNGCNLPIEFWYKNGELNDEVISKLADLNVVCKNITHYSTTPIESYAIKPFAIINSSFKEVLFLDADNNCVTDPTYLFEHDDYKKTGVIFWPDFWKTDSQNPIWKIVDSKDYEEYEQESGQILINKELCWAELNLCMYFNLNRAVYYQFLLGDKDTYKFAWKALRKRYAMISTPVGYCGYSSVPNRLFSKGVAMVQHDFDGNVIFIHQNMAKWDVTKENEYLWEEIKRFKADAKSRLYVQKKIELPNGEEAIVFDIEGDVFVNSCKDELHTKEKFCLETLRELRSSDFYHRFILYLYISRHRGEV